MEEITKFVYPEAPKDAQELSVDFHEHLLYSNLIKEIILKTKGRLDVQILRKLK